MTENLNDLIARIKDDDIASFNEVFRLFHKKLFAFVYKTVSDVEESEEVVQEVFIKVWNSRNKLQTDTNFQSFLYTMARNMVINKYHRKIREKAYKDYKIVTSESYSNDVENQYDYNELKKFYDQAVENLPGKRKEVFILSRREGLSYHEIAERLNISVKTVETHIQLSLQYLRKFFKRQELLIFILVHIL